MEIILSSKTDYADLSSTQDSHIHSHGFSEQLKYINDYLATEKRNRDSDENRQLNDTDPVTPMFDPRLLKGLKTANNANGPQKHKRHQKQQR